VLSGRGLCDELITRPEESYRLCRVVVCDLETSRMGAPYIYIYDISRLRVKKWGGNLHKVNLCQSPLTLGRKQFPKRRVLRRLYFNQENVPSPAGIHSNNK